MTKRNRYLLLALGFLAFLILAPLIIFYVRGVNYNFATGRFYNTGILSVKADPDSANIFLDGSLKRTRSGDIKFLKPQSYFLSIKREGYFDWSKRLEVGPGQVTWAGPGYNAIHLLKTSGLKQILADEVVDFYFSQNKILALKKTGVVSFDLPNPQYQKFYALPEPASVIAAADPDATKIILANPAHDNKDADIFYLNLQTGNVLNLSTLFVGLPKFSFGPDGNLLALNGGNLYVCNPEAKSKTLLYSGVKAFSIQDGELYWLQQKAQGSVIATSQSPYNNPQILFNNIANTANAEIIVNFEKQILLLADGTLYAANNPMQKLAENISSINYKQDTGSIAVGEGNELYWLDMPSLSLNFISRDISTLKAPLINPSIGWAFAIQNNHVLAIELDRRDAQNQYVLFLGNDVKKIAADAAGKNLMVLDNQKLIFAQIR